MRTVSTSLVLAGLAIAWPSSHAVGDLVVDSWSLLSGVSDSGGQQGVYFTSVKNPFQNSHIALYNSSNASASYDFGWTGDSAHFDVTANQHLEQLRGFSVSEGRIHLIPAIDSIMTLQGTWQYAWPSTVTGDTVIDLNIFDDQTGEQIVDAGALGGNVGIGPSHGILSVQDSALLLAGVQYLVYYSVNVHFYDLPPPGAYGEASGEAHFEINPVPEPATLALLAIVYPLRRALLLAPRRRRR